MRNRQVHEGSGDDELARRLEAYAAARLSPDAATSARMRARVLREARFRALAGEASVHDVQAASLTSAETIAASSGPVATRPTPLRRKATRRLGALLIAATLVLGTVASASASSRAGGPLYGVRLWLEEITLPADPDARAMAEISRLDERIDEARTAAAAGDQGAVAAAIAAYREILADTLGLPNADLNDRLEAALGRHLVVLEAVSDQVPAAAQQGIENAIEHSSRAVNQLKARNNPGTGPGSQQGGPKPSTGPAQPDRTPKPRVTPDVEVTPKPGKTPPAKETKPPDEPEPAEATDPPATPRPGPPSSRPDTPQNRETDGGKPQR